MMSEFVSGYGRAAFLAAERAQRAASRDWTLRQMAESVIKAWDEWNGGPHAGDLDRAIEAMRQVLDHDSR